MKNRITIGAFLFLIGLATTLHTQAQDYLVKVTGDTLYGDLKPLNFGPEKKVQIKGTDNKKQTISMFQIKFYSLEKELYYPVKGPGGYTFMKLMKEGYLSLYAFQAENQTQYDNRFLLKRDGKGTEVPNLSFKKIMTNFLEDCNQVTDKIDKGILAKRDLEIIVDEYNACISAKTNEIVATKPVLKAVDTWVALEDKIKSHDSFDGKDNALEMIGEIKMKVSKSEKVPNFLTQGLKDAITPDDLKPHLDAALNSLKQ